MQAMMTLENAYAIPANSLPTPADSPVENAPTNLHRRVSRSGSISRYSSRSSIHFQRDSQSFFSRHQPDQDNVFTEKGSSMDARRFTSDLDNSLLQQIHVLRSELESKGKMIDSLEESLQQSKTEAAKLSEELHKRSAESKDVKRQLQLFENETLSALGDLARERDSAIESMGESRKRLEISNKKLRSQEEDAERFQAIRDKEQDQWTKDRQGLERKLHIMENRLRTMVAEMVAAESLGGNRPPTSNSDYDGMQWAAKSDTFSIRSGSRPGSRMSNRSAHEGRDSRDFQGRAPSRLSALHEVGESTSSLSLAAELEGEDSEPGDEIEDIDLELPSPAALPEELSYRPSRYSQDVKARKVMGLPIDYNDTSRGEGGFAARGIGSNEDARSNIGTNGEILAYGENSSQTSAPPLSTTHSMRPTAPNTDAHTQTDDDFLYNHTSLHSSNIPASLLANNAPSPPVTIPWTHAHAGTQTANTQERPVSVSDTRAPALKAGSIVSTRATQTERDSLDEGRLLPNASIRMGTIINKYSTNGDIPTIAIHPPGSRPPSSHTSVMLPPRTKNAGTLTSIDLPRNVRSISTQTTQPFSIVPPPPRQASFTAISRIQERRKQPGASIPPKSSRRKLKSPPPLLKNEPPPASPPLSTLQKMYPGGNDDGPLNDKHQFGPRRPVRSASILAGFSDDNDDINHENNDHFSDDDYSVAPPIRKTLSKVKDSWRLIPQSHQTELDRIESMSDTEAQAEAGSSEPVNKAAPRESSDLTTSPKDVLPNTSRKIVNKPSTRKSSLASNGPSHIQRHRSPSVPSVSTGSTGQVPPPFPVPTRSSSRKVPTSASDGAASPTPYATSFFTTRRQQQQARPISKRKPLRKTQSAAAVTEPTMTPDLIPPLPKYTKPNPPETPTTDRNGRAQPHVLEASVSDARTQRFSSASPKSPTAPTSVESQGSDVIHAVTQTMIGEWMFKYVRKRKSFGITENAQNEFDKGSVGATRHKRWVWVLPRERAVVWSEKEPTTTLAIGGKGARKLTIQSVVDVPDHTSLPKGYNIDQIFNRSILILTPERALKLTAMSRERHFIWLTALSYISSSDFNLTLIEHPPSVAPTPTRGSICVHKHDERPSEDAAEAPQVPRISAHSRKRSSTGPQKPPMSLNAFHSYSTNAVATASNYDLHAPPLTQERPAKSHSGPATAVPTMTRSTTEPGVVPNGAFDAIGTVRMEAFVEEEGRWSSESVPAVDKVGGRARAESRGKRKDMAYWGVDDPFRGF